MTVVKGMIVICEWPYFFPVTVKCLFFLVNLDLSVAVSCDCLKLFSVVTNNVLFRPKTLF